jgi:hypothetical protein
MRSRLVKGNNRPASTGSALAAHWVECSMPTCYTKPDQTQSRRVRKNHSITGTEGSDYDINPMLMAAAVVVSIQDIAARVGRLSTLRRLCHKAEWSATPKRLRGGNGISSAKACTMPYCGQPRFPR